MDNLEAYTRQKGIPLEEISEEQFTRVNFQQLHFLIIKVNLGSYENPCDPCWDLLRNRLYQGNKVWFTNTLQEEKWEELFLQTLQFPQRFTSVLYRTITQQQRQRFLYACQAYGKYQP
jgi:hypothetical protein